MQSARLHPAAVLSVAGTAIRATLPVATAVQAALECHALQAVQVLAAVVQATVQVVAGAVQVMVLPGAEAQAAVAAEAPVAVHEAAHADDTHEQYI